MRDQEEKIMAAPNWTLNQILNQLNTGNLWFGTQITYSFPTTSTLMYTNGGEGGGFQPLTGNQITMATYALAGWDDLITLDFVQSAGVTDIEFGYTSTGIGFAHAYYPTNGSVWFNSTENVLFNPTIGKYGYETFLHELGHALGLDHMGDYDASDPNSVHPYSFQDSSVLSLMSYFGPSHSDGEGQVQWADWEKGGISFAVQTPMVNDIMAIQTMYGAETTTRVGDTIYGFNSNITGSAETFYNFALNDNPILTIFDSSGIDTLDLSGYATRCNISLVAGSYSDCNEMTFNIGIAYTATIENAVGGSASDTLTGNDAANVLTGGRGNDIINGGGGSDIAVFAGAFAAYTIVTNGTGSYTVTGADGTDTLSSIEILRFTDRDFPGGGTGPIVSVPLVDQDADPGALFTFAIPAGSFTDPNNDALTYTAKLESGAALPAWLTFDAATRTFSGTPGAGDLGTLSIVVSASDATASVTDTFVLVVGDATGGADIIGTVGPDSLTGTSAAESIFALAGNDIVKAGGGDDVIEGGRGYDQLWGESGGDVFAYNAVGESSFFTDRFDQIMDFNRTEGDMIDANTKRAGNQVFRFDTQGDGWASRGQLSYWIDGGQTHIYGNTDRDKQAEFYLAVIGEIVFQAADFAL
jgi:serralysin